MRELDIIKLANDVRTKNYDKVYELKTKGFNIDGDKINILINTKDMTSMIGSVWTNAEHIRLEIDRSVVDKMNRALIKDAFPNGIMRALLNKLKGYIKWVK